MGGSCGDGIVQSGEACDDGNTASGDGCSATCTSEQSQTPAINLTIDKPAIPTELMTTHMITATVTGSGGFSGAVNLTATVVDTATNAPIPGWTVALDNATLNLAANGTATAIAVLTIPSENKGLNATVKIDANSSAGAKQATSTVTATNQITFPITLNTGCVYPTPGTTNVTIGTKVRWMNKATSNITIHVDANQNGIAHQPDPGSAPNTAYERTVTGNPGAAFSWYCHAPGPNVSNRLLQAVAP